MAIEEFVWSLVAPTGFRTASYANRAAYIADIEDGKVQDPRDGNKVLLPADGTAKPPIKIVLNGGNLSLEMIKGGVPTGVQPVTWFLGPVVEQVATDAGTVELAVLRADALANPNVKESDILVVRAVTADGRQASLDVTPVPGTAPVNTVAPAITGTAQVGQTLTVSNGTWTGTAPITYSRQWQSGGNPVGTGATTYVPVAGDVGKVITCVVTATNAVASAPAITTAPTAAVIA